MECRPHGTVDWRPVSAHSYDTDGKIAELDLVGRHYELFGYLAGVRGGWMGPVFPVRGFPDDASPQMKDRYADEFKDSGYGSHTPQWLMLDEFIRCLRKSGKKIRRINTSKYDPKSHKMKISEYLYWVNYAWDVIENYKLDSIIAGSRLKPEVRFIFWFDS